VIVTVNVPSCFCPTSFTPTEPATLIAVALSLAATEVCPTAYVTGIELPRTSDIVQRTAVCTLLLNVTLTATSAAMPSYLSINFAELKDSNDAAHFPSGISVVVTVVVAVEVTDVVCVAVGVVTADVLAVDVAVDAAVDVPVSVAVKE